MNVCDGDMMRTVPTLCEVNVEDEIDRLQKDISVRSIADLLWGGARGPGLVYTVAELAKSATTLSDSITRITKDIYGEDGVRNSVRVLERRVESLNNDFTTLQKLINKIIIFLAIIGIGTLLVDGRVLYTIVPELAK